MRHQPAAYREALRRAQHLVDSVARFGSLALTNQSRAEREALLLLESLEGLPYTPTQQAFEDALRQALRSLERLRKQLSTPGSLRAIPAEKYTAFLADVRALENFTRGLTAGKVS